MKGTITNINHGIGKVKGDDGKDYKFNKKTRFRSGSADEAKRLQRIEFEPDGRWASNAKLLDEFIEVEESPQSEAQSQSNEQGAAYRFLNPYNFIRFITGSRPNNHVLGDAPPPPHDRYVGLTGKITCHVETVTPLFISDSHAIDKKQTSNGKDHFTYRFFEYDGSPAIPATSLRGMVRNVFEAVTNSCVSVFTEDEPYAMEYRPTSLPRGDQLIPLRVIDFDNHGAALCEILDGDRTKPANSPSDNRATVISTGSVKNSYRHRVIFHDNQTNQDRPFFASSLPASVKDGDRVAARIMERTTLHNSRRYQYFVVNQIVPFLHHTSLTAQPGERIVYGWVHITGPNIERKHDERLFFRWDDSTPAPVYDFSRIPSAYQVVIKKEIVQEYNKHLEEYWDRNKNQVNSLGSKPWPPSVSTLPHPSTFIEDGRKLEKNDLVYAVGRYGPGGTLANVRHLRSVSIPRIRYENPRQVLLKNAIKYQQPCQSYNKLCPACRMFGWVYQSKEGKDKPDPSAYAGRVRFSHAKLSGEPKWENEGVTLSILSSPKPTTTSFYLLSKEGKPTANITYNNNDAKLRGRKIYRHHGKNRDIWPEAKMVSKDNDPDKGKSDQNRSLKQVLSAENKFTFDLYFENLAEEELGALLFALELRKEWVHRIGYGKPLGLGSIDINVTQVKSINWKTKFSTIRDEEFFIDQDKDALIEKFMSFMADHYKDEFDAVLRDLEVLLGAEPTLPVHYPRPPFKGTPGRNPEGKQFEWFVGNKQRISKMDRYQIPDPEIPPLAEDDTEGMELMDRKGNPL